MSVDVPIFVSELRAANLLDMKPAQFRSLVNGGQLPKPRLIAGLERWCVEHLRAIASGQAADGIGGIDW